MPNLTRNFPVKPNQILQFRTPQGQVCRGKVNPLLIFPTHVVVDRGNGQPVVVSDANVVLEPCDYLAGIVKTSLGVRP